MYIDTTFDRELGPESATARRSSATATVTTATVTTGTGTATVTTAPPNDSEAPLQVERQ